MILSDSLPYDPFALGALPGVAPLDSADWLLLDSAYGAQMAERRRLLATRRDAVLALLPEADAAAQELLTHALAHLPPGFTVAHGQVTCPDGTVQPIAPDDPLGTLGRICQEDFCLMQKPDGATEHVLTGAVLCFPASWRLAEKIGRPLLAIHRPVHDYDDALARRVQRLFDGVQPGRPLWRANALWYEDPALHQPRSEASPRPLGGRDTAPFLRSERQVISRLPGCGAVVFSIRTYMLARATVLARDRA